MIVHCMAGREACVEEGHGWKEIDRCRDHRKDGRRSLEGSVVVLYILLSRPSVR